jgi:DNA polymerase type B, organellar and viral
MDIISVDTGTVELHARKLEQQRRARQRYDARNPGRNRNPNRCKQKDKPFIGWDGEGPRDAGYALFGSSDGDEICHPYLGTAECLDLILSREALVPDAIHVWFGSNYDVSMILKDIGWRGYSALKHWNRTVWKDYEIEHIPGKWLQIKAHGLTAKIFDIHSFFGSSYVKALTDMHCGTESERASMAADKARRSEFVWADIDSIRTYWRAELRLMSELCNILRDAFLDAGFDLRSWHGPGAIANLAMRKHHVFDAMSECPTKVRKAARRAFAGGRFEMFRGGRICTKIINPDIHSAYPFFATQLPNLAKGYWREGKTYEPGKFAVYHIRYKSPPDPMRPFPLFRRLETGEVVWDNNVDGWYWAPEAELVADDEHAEFIESYVFEEDNPKDRPFAWLAEYYNIRKSYVKAGSILEYVYKLIINSVYGQLAQRTGWDKKNRRAPRSHQLEWAGYITSACRATVWKVAKSCGDSLISIDTDGIYATGGIGDLDRGDNLGQWDVNEYDGGIFWQSGIYALETNLGYPKELGYDWIKGKTRGIPKGKYQPQDLIDALDRGESLKLRKNTFVGYGLALNGRRDELNSWTQDDVEIIFGGEGKRYHNARSCGSKTCNGYSHDFISRPTRFHPADTIMSFPHYLPWEDNDKLVNAKKRLIDDVTIFDANHLDWDEEWVMAYG